MQWPYERMRSYLYGQRVRSPSGYQWQVTKRTATQEISEKVPTYVPATRIYYREARRPWFFQTYEIIFVDTMVLDSPWRGVFKFDGNKDDWYKETVITSGKTYQEALKLIQDFDKMREKETHYSKNIDRYHHSYVSEPKGLQSLGINHP